jgi:serine/threonine protein kinase
MDKYIGIEMGRYRILEPLGQGGMATVYKAYDTRLEREVAVKVIRTELFGSAVQEGLLKRFGREAMALAKLIHPNIVSVIDYGNYAGSPYLVMPYLPGGTLKQHMGKLIPWREATRVLLPVARALQYAHEQGIIHRDVKPSNILLTPSGEPMLTDFGIAKILDVEEGQTLTGTGMVGTPEYMAPEQWVGKVTPQSDVYSLGVVFYEMVTGRTPYRAETPAAVLIKQTNDPLPRPRQFVTDLPEAVEKLLFKALAKEPEDRYETMGAFAGALEGLLKVGEYQKTQFTGARIAKQEKSGPGEAFPSEVTRDERSAIEMARPTAGPIRSAQPERIGAIEQTLSARAGISAGGKEGKPSHAGLWLGGIAVSLLGISAIAGIVFGVMYFRNHQGDNSPPTSATSVPVIPTPEATATSSELIQPTITPVLATSTILPPTQQPPTFTPLSEPIKLAFISGEIPESRNADVYVANEDGSHLVCVACSPKYEGEPSLSTDGKWVVYHAVTSSGTTDIFLVSASGGSPSNLTSTPSESERDAAFSPDRTMIAYQVGAGDARYENGDIYTMDINGGNRRTLGLKGRGPAWSPDGNSLAFMQYDNGSSTWQVHVYNFSTDQSIQITNVSQNARWPAWSPDGKYIAFNTTSSASNLNPDGVWYISADGNGSPVLVIQGNGGAGRPSWSANGLIVFNTSNGIEAIRPDGSGQFILIHDSKAYAPAWSR